MTLPTTQGGHSRAGSVATAANQDLQRARGDWSPGLKSDGSASLPPAVVALDADAAHQVNGTLTLSAGKVYEVEILGPNPVPVDANGQPDQTYYVQLMLVAAGAAAPADASVQLGTHLLQGDLRLLVPLADADLYAIRAAGKAGLSVHVVPGQE